jgi:hypothetical protein
MAKKNSRIVKGAFVTYRDVVERWDGSAHEVSRSAARGDTIKVVPQEEKRLDHLDMLMPPGTPETDLRTLEKQLQEQAKRDRQVAGLDPEAAAQLRAAQAADGEPILPDVTVPFDAAAASDAEIAAWISEAKPNAPDTVAAAIDDATLAQRILDAENVARAGSPRKSVVEGLDTIISSGDDKAEGK